MAVLPAEGRERDLGVLQVGVSSRVIAQRFGRKEMFYLTTHSTHFIYGYMASDIWLRTILIVRKEIRCRNLGAIGLSKARSVMQPRLLSN